MRSILVLLLLFVCEVVPAGEPLKNTVGMPDDLFKLMSRVRQSPMRGGEFMKALPTEFRRNYSIMVDSASNQPASPLRPRIIMNSGDGTTQIAVSIDSPEHFEVQNFHQRRFYHSDLNARSSEVNLNERSCQRCHYDRPNWSTYPVWAGQLGFIHDTIYEGSEQAKLYKHLLETLAEDPIFSQLELPRGVAVKKNKEGNYEAKIEFTAGSVSFKTINGQQVRQGGPHLRLTSEAYGNGDRMIDQLHGLNRERVKRETEEAINLDVVKAALVAGLQSNKSCFDVTYGEDMAKLVGDFVPKKLLAKLLAHFGVKSFEELEKDTMKRILSAHNRKLAQIKQSLRQVVLANAKVAGETLTNNQIEARIFQELHFSHDVPQLYDGEDKDLTTIQPDYGAKQLSLIRLLLETSGVPVNRWSMETIGGSANYLLRDAESNYISDVFRAALQALNAKPTGVRFEDGTTPDCSKLAKLSQAAMASFAYVPKPDAPPHPPKSH